MLRLTRRKGSPPWIPITSKTPSSKTTCTLFGLQSTSTLEGKDFGIKRVYQCRFTFNDINDKKQFQKQIRDRQLLAELKTTMITINGVDRSRSQLVQFWSENQQSVRAEKITYLASKVGICDEWHINDFRVQERSRNKNGDIFLETRSPKSNTEAVVLRFAFEKAAGERPQSFSRLYSLEPSFPNSLANYLCREKKVSDTI